MTSRLLQQLPVHGSGLGGIPGVYPHGIDLALAGMELAGKGVLHAIRGRMMGMDIENLRHKAMG
jgi:hypothetical protein